MGIILSTLNVSLEQLSLECNQAQVREGATVISTSTRNFPNLLGKNTNVYLGSAELAATGVITAKADQIYKYMNFNQIEEYVETAKTVA